MLTPLLGVFVVIGPAIPADIDPPNKQISDFSISFRSMLTPQIG